MGRLVVTGAQDFGKAAPSYPDLRGDLPRTASPQTEKVKGIPGGESSVNRF